MNEIKPKIQFTYHEYVNTWKELLKGLYFRIVSVVDLQEDKTQAFDLKLFTLLPSLADIMLTNESKVGKKITESLKEDIVLELLEDMFPQEMLRKQWREFYDGFSPIMHAVLIESSKTVSSEVQLVGLSNLLLDKIPMDNTKKTATLNQLSLELHEAMQAILKLAKNTGLSPKLMGKPNFMVLRD